MLKLNCEFLPTTRKEGGHTVLNVHIESTKMFEIKWLKLTFHCMIAIHVQIFFGGVCVCYIINKTVQTFILSPIHASYISVIQHLKFSFSSFLDFRYTVKKNSDSGTQLLNFSYIALKFQSHNY
jgi:hypothetical protein